ncbi:MAG: cytochrome c [Alphaproteobacteria bacterium]
MIRYPKKSLPAALSLMAIALIAGGLAAEEPHMPRPPAGYGSGESDFKNYCAACHGADAAGRRVIETPDGPHLLARPADLTSLARRNGDAYPAAYVYRVIAGDPTRDSPRLMPHWDGEFRAELGSGLHAALVTPGRIHAIVDYLETLQK